MSQYADHCSTIKEMIKKYPNAEEAVVDTIFEMLTNQDWELQSIIEILENGKGITATADLLINQKQTILKGWMG